MSERNEMIVSLVKELLGPRDGPEELLPKDREPRSEYITGVLAPEMDERENDPDADVDEVIEEASDDEDQGAEGVIIASASAFSPALDPKSQPRTMGLTFVVTAEGEDTKPLIDICVSWARYTQKAGWQREPQGVILNSESPTRDYHWKDVGDDVDLYMRVGSSLNGHVRVSLYLVNQRSTIGRRPSTEDYLFQPQIRVCCGDGTKLEPIEFISPAGGAAQDSLASEDAQLAMLYRDRVALARGHLCGALWKEIDPERPHPSLMAPNAAPFAWTDRALFSQEEQARFSPPDVRTEFIPTYPIEAPIWDWPEGASPQLDPLSLAKAWLPEDIHTNLNPLVEGYERWIELQEQKIPQEYQQLATDNLNQCKQVAKRIREGIEWLVKDEEVRLAFCFANRAIALQSEWARNRKRKGDPYSWRPFQLAFILLNISALADPTHNDREICDLLWFPTGGGKTEAYLAVAAFTLALRRRRALQQGDERAGAGVGVLSRYTLRLLTIQQFRRALGLITACEVLRVAYLNRSNVPTGWRPRGCKDKSQFIWGGIRFSLGLWVGGNVTPNKMLGYSIPPSNRQHIAGAMDILRGVSNKGYNGFDRSLKREFKGKSVTANGDPAQVLNCPVCGTLLAIPENGLLAGPHKLHFVFTGQVRNHPTSILFNTTKIKLDEEPILTSHNSSGTYTLSLSFTIAQDHSLRAHDIDRWWHETIKPSLKKPTLLAAHPARPGYFLSSFENVRGNQKPHTFEIYCPYPSCFLNDKRSWAEEVPVSVGATTVAKQMNLQALQSNELPSTYGLEWQEIPTPLRSHKDNKQIAARIPIPAYTTDDQVYHRCPSMVVATVDKFARLAFEPKASSLFGNVSHYHARWGYYREGCPPDSSAGLEEEPRQHPRGYSSKQQLHLPVPAFEPPDLIIQDELHLIEGPLGSMVGLYETAIDALGERIIQNQPIRPKYVASTATVRQANEQIQSLFNRKLCQFPPSAINVDKRFFASERKDPHPLDSSKAGRLYVAVAAPGKGAQTPIVRIWSGLLAAAQQLYDSGATETLDNFWTLVGYFNALRELAGAKALYRQDIHERIGDARQLNKQIVELSSRANSMKLPGLLKRLEEPWGEDAVLATSMFGTGVDVERLGLMVVHGQPKTTSAYIQATGRVGREKGGLVVTFFRASRPRDLDHYEFFTGYHRMLYRFVEPITVTPFAPGAQKRGLGPLLVALLRQAAQIRGQEVTGEWRLEQRIKNDRYYSNAILMAKYRRTPEVSQLPQLFEERAQQQPEGRRPSAETTKAEVASELDRWHSMASKHKPDSNEARNRLVYSESGQHGAQRDVILGDAQHQLNQREVAFKNAPSSLRDVEETTHFEG